MAAAADGKAARKGKMVTTMMMVRKPIIAMKRNNEKIKR